MKPYTILFAALLCPLSPANAQSQQAVRVVEFCPAPGQFVNTLPTIDNTMTKEQRLQACEEQLQDGNPISLGAAGGYITLALDQPIKNGKGSDLRIIGNAFYAQNDPVYGDATIGGSIEPGIVYAGVGASPETAEWYELAGSEYYTTQRHNFHITYYKPTAETGEHNIPFSTFDQYIKFDAKWTEPNGAERDTTGYLMKNSFHSQTYWPLWEGKEDMTFKGGLLPDNAINYGGDGSDEDNPQNWISYRYAADSYGYADAALKSDETYTTFDLDWAVDNEGNPVKLSHADFIRIQTGVLQQCGWTGEMSTEVSSIENLHLIPGYDDNPIVITPRKRPTGINTLTDATRHEVMRLSIDGRRLDKPEKGINIVKYSDGTTRKTIN